MCLVSLAYGQLWLARHLVEALLLPWQRYTSRANTQQHTPRQVQRGFAQLIQQIGSRAPSPQTRGIPSGRPTGTQLNLRAHLSTGQVSPTPEALSLQGHSIIGLIV